MPDLATLFIKVDSQGVVTASRDLNKLTGDSQKTEKATESVTAGFSKLKAAVIALGGAYAALKMMQYIKDATLLAARYETLGVVMRVVGNNAGYSGAQMNVFAGGLQKAGIAMVESRNTLARMVQAQIDLKDSQKLARIAQDAAVIGNTNSSQSFEQMIYGIQTGMPRILRTIGLNVDFNAAVQALALSLDKKTDALSETEIMQARVNAVVKAGVLIEGTYEGAMETAGKQVLSLTRHLDNLKVLLGAVFTPALAEGIGFITGEIKGLNSELEKSIEKWADWGNKIRLVVIKAEIELQDFLFGLELIRETIAGIGLIYATPGLLLEKAGVEGTGEHFRFFSDMMTSAIDGVAKHKQGIADLVTKYNDLVEAMSPAGKAAAKAAADALEATRLQAVAAAKAVEVVEAATKEQLKIQDDFATAYKKSTLTVQEFETDSLNVQVAAFRAAKVNEVQLETWMQNELKNIKLRAQNEALALYEELAINDDFYAQKAIDTMGRILDAQEVAWAKTELGAEGAHKLRLQREDEYENKVLETTEVVNKARETSSGGSLGGVHDLGRKLNVAGPTYVTYKVDGLRFSSNAAAQTYIAEKEAAAAAAERAAGEAQRAAEEEAQRQIDIATQRVDLNIELLMAEGHTVEAVAIQRMQELAAMDESLRPLQQRLYYLEDEAAAADAAAEAAEKAAEATRDLIAAQDASLKTWENSIAALVSQGQAIKDFLNSLGATGVSMTLSAARGAYMADLAGARAGDPTSYGRITQSAGALISTAGQTAGSSLEMARIVAGIKSELSALQPVVDLDSNIELLKAIREATKDTATSVDRLDVLGIKAIFDLDAVINIVENSTGIDPAIRDLMVTQTAEYQIFLQAQLSSDVGEDLKRVLIDGSGTYATTVTAALGTVDAESRKLALTAAGDYLSTVRAAMGLSDPGAVTLALETANAMLSTVTAALGAGDVEAVRLATQQVNEMRAIITAALATDATTQQLKDMLTNSGNITTTIDGTMSWNPNDPLKAIWQAILAQTAATATNTGRLHVVATVETRPYKDYGRGAFLPAAGKVYWSDGHVSSYAKGGVFDQGNVIPFARGDIFNTPTTFPMANGMGLLGEAGPEAIMPLTRIGGKLGVKSMGGVDSPELLAEIRMLRAEVKVGNLAIARSTTKAAKVLTDFDYNGMPAEREIN